MISDSPSVSAAWQLVTSAMTGDFKRDMACSLRYWLPKGQDSYRKRVDIYTGDEKSVVEFGAGYGGMPQALYNHGFRGVYKIIDLPKMIEMQKRWLSENCPDVNVEWVDSPDGGEDALIAHYSLSEAPFAVRDKVLEAARNIPLIDIIYPDRFIENGWAGGENYNNEAYFAEAFTRFFPGHTFHETPMDTGHGRRAVGRCISSWCE